MSDTALQLTVPGESDFIFTGMEIPDHIAFGGKQKLSVHELVGGARVVEAMGRSDMPLQWSGYLFGPNALARARFLDYLRASGKQAVLTWSELFYRVVVEEFSADFERSYNLPYRISFAVVQDLAQSMSAITRNTLNDALDEDMVSALPIVTIIGDQLLQASYDDLKNGLKSLPAIVTAVQYSPMSVPNFYLPIPNYHLPVPNVNQPSPDLSQTTATLLGGLAAKLAVLQSRIDDMIAAAAQSTPPDLGAAAPNYAMALQAAWLSQQSATASNVAELYALKAIAGRMGRNLGMGE